MATEVDSLTINVAGQDPDSVPLDSFVKVIYATRSLLSELDEKKTLQWKITAASLASPFTITLTAEATKERWDKDVVNDCLEVFREATRRTPRPRIKKPSVIRRAKSIVNVLNDGVAEIVFSAPGREPVRAAKKLPSVEKQAEGVSLDYRDWVELDGILETVTIAGGMRFFVRDPLNNQRTECLVDRDQFIDALEAMKLPVPRVSVYGLARYESDKPVTIRIESFSVLPSLEDHPGLYAVQGINITGGVDSVDYVRSLRDDD